MEKSEKKNGFIGKLLILSATIVWGSSFVVLKDTLSAFGDGHFTFFILACRFLIASVIFLAFSVKRFKEFNKKILIHGIILGVILFFAYAVQTVALNYTTPSKNAFLTETYCVFVPFIMYFFFKKEIGFKNFVTALVCLAGVVIIAFFGRNENAPNELLGDGLTVLCGVFYALQMIFISQFNKDDSFLLLIVEMSVVTVLCFGTSAIIEFPKYSSSLSFNFECGWRIVYLGVFATAYAQFAQLHGQKYTTPTTTSLIMCFEGVFSVLFEFIFGYNNLNAYIITGFVLILSTLVINEIDFVAIGNRLKPKKEAQLVNGSSESTIKEDKDEKITR